MPTRIIFFLCALSDGQCERNVFIHIPPPLSLLLFHLLTPAVSCPDNSSPTGNPPTCTCDDTYTGSITWNAVSSAWDGSCLKSCDAPNISANQDLGTCSGDGLTSGATCNISCKSGVAYATGGDAQVSCTNGNLSGSTLTCAGNCL